jgi:hypothetical protein
VTEVCDCIHAFHGIYPNAVAERHLNIYICYAGPIYYITLETRTRALKHTHELQVKFLSLDLCNLCYLRPFYVCDECTSLHVCVIEKAKYVHTSRLHEMHYLSGCIRTCSILPQELIYSGEKWGISFVCSCSP